MPKTAHLRLISILLGAAMAALASAAYPAGRVALVIGNTTYEKLAPLANPGADAARMAELLAASGFTVMSCDGKRPGCFDLDRGDMLDALEEFRDMARGADLALAYYAGHGMQTAEGNVIAPTDIEVSCGDWATRRSVMLDDVLTSMQGARERIVILDACRNDPFQAQQCLERGARPLSFGSIAVPDSTSRLLLVTSTQNGQFAQDGPAGGHSPFAAALFEVMGEASRRRFDQMLDLVTKRVVERTAAANFTQVPEILIRGGAPEACLAGSCGGEGSDEALRAEIAALRAANARNQELESMVVALLRSAGHENPEELPLEERRQIFAGIMDAGRDLARRGAEGEVALAALRDGDASAAEALFAEQAAATSAEQRQEAARAARHLAALARPFDVVKAAQGFAEAARLDPGDLQVWIELAEAERVAGNGAAAAEAYAAGLGLAARGAGTPAQRMWVTEGAADLDYNGGRAASALKLYRQVVAIAERELKADPGNGEFRRGLIIGTLNLGHLDMDAGRPKKALNYFQSALKLATAYAAEEPWNPRWQFEIGRSQERIGRIRQAQGRNDLALEAYRRKHAIMTGLLRQNPNDPVWIRDLSLADEFIGDMALAAGDRRAALASYEASLSRMVPLSERDPGNTSHLRFTSVTYLKAGDVHESLGELDRARDHFRAGMQVSEALVALDPTNGTWRWDLFRAYQRMASSTPPGTEYHAKALEVIEAMQADGQLAPDNRRWIKITRDRLKASRRG